MADKDLVRRVRDKSLTAVDLMKLASEDKIKEAEALLAAMKEAWKWEPNEISSRPGKAPVFKSRGRVVVLGKDGVWKPRTPPK